MPEIFLDNRIKNFLELFFEPDEKPVQSLLFYGEEAVGKKTTALSFAKALLCLKDKKVWGGCENCQNCLMFDKGLSPDFLIIQPVNNDVPIETARQAIEFLHYEPQVSSMRILIVNKADRLKEDAQNTFLKTLEEPPKNTLIIFITALPQKLLPTILSRLLPLRFIRSFSEEIAGFLSKNYHLNQTKSMEIAGMSGGKIGLAVNLLDKDYLKNIEENQNKLAVIIGSDFNDRIKYIQELTNDKMNLLKTLKVWLEMLSCDIKTEIQKQGGNLKLPLGAKIKLTKELLRAFHLISNSNINSSLLLENIFLSQ